MDALAFEELLLEAFERRGLRVIRNRAYIGDGGLLIADAIQLFEQRLGRPVSPGEARNMLGDFVDFCLIGARRSRKAPTPERKWRGWHGPEE